MINTVKHIYTHDKQSHTYTHMINTVTHTYTHMQRTFMPDFMV